MERKAHYALIGLFTFAVVAGAFGFLVDEHNPPTRAFARIGFQRGEVGVIGNLGVQPFRRRGDGIAERRDR